MAPRSAEVRLFSPYFSHRATHSPFGARPATAPAIHSFDPILTAGRDRPVDACGRVRRELLADRAERAGSLRVRVRRRLRGYAVDSDLAHPPPDTDHTGSARRHGDPGAPR